VQLTSDVSVARRVSKGGEDARFTEFVVARWGALVRTAYLLTGDFHEAEDLVQTTLAKIYPHWRRIGGADASQYVRRALVNNNRSRVRRRRVVQQLTSFLPDTPAPVRGHQDRDVLVAALAALPERQRAVVVLRYWEDLSVEEVAHELGCSVGTVKSQASRALAKLRTDPNLAAHPDDFLGAPR
jgi:RNA polymerase sigma-70 factor (sigma-E family)